MSRIEALVSLTAINHGSELHDDESLLWACLERHKE
jgi:hypothetical protein